MLPCYVSSPSSHLPEDFPSSLVVLGALILSQKNTTSFFQEDLTPTDRSSFLLVNTITPTDNKYLQHIYPLPSYKNILLQYLFSYICNCLNIYFLFSGQSPIPIKTPSSEQLLYYDFLNYIIHLHIKELYPNYNPF
jgi:hypothetical protein